MKLSQLFGKTSKTAGKDLSIDSNRLLVQAGFIRESTAGRYYLLPLGLAVHRNIEEVIRSQMNQAGGQEVLMPVLHPLELWRETNRTTTTGFELMKIKDRRGAEFALGGTAEEMAVDLVRKFNISYKDLPFNIYQFSMKFRDEIRARGGLLRVREFVMKDAYSFSTEAQFQEIYQQMGDVYSSIFKDLGLDTAKVAADNGYIGGDYCHEFIVESPVGESRYFVNTLTGENAHEDVAKVQADNKNIDDALKPLQPITAKRGKTMQDGAKFHNLPLWQQIKDVLYVDEASKRYILALIRGDYDVNETKLTHVADAWDLRPATDEEIGNDLDSEPGFISPVNFLKKAKNSGYKVIVVADSSLKTIKNAYGGANKKNQDLLNINIDRDFKPDVEGDIALAKPGDNLIEKRGIEVGNIFQLGFHYSKLMKDAEYTDEKGHRQKYYMGCYGIGIGRTMAAIVEKYHDDKGLVWPEAIAPAKVHLIRIGDKSNVVKQADQLYKLLTDKGIAVLYDDRNARPGEMFADADLIGIPNRVVISDKTIMSSSLEFKQRTEQEPKQVSQKQLLEMLQITA